MSASSKVNISIRVRPFLPTEQQDDALLIAPHHAADPEGSVSVSNPRDVNQRFRFGFRSCWDQSATQEAIFDRDVRPILEQVLAGYTACIFCYGVTSSGKTHTMQGVPGQAGIIPRVIEYFFKSGLTGSRRTQVAVSYMEIYREEVYDLLVVRADAPKLQIRESGGDIFVANLTETLITSPSDFSRIFSLASMSRSTGATLLNDKSSRSHAILGIRVRVATANGTVTEGKINLIDLAGSENNKLTGNDPSRMAESSAINKSLSVLGQVVDALNKGLPRVPYRDSKLTRILQPFLGGNSLSLLICNLAPGIKFRQDTLNTLGFASRTREVENCPVAAAVTEGGAGRFARRMSELPRPRNSLLPMPAAPNTLAPLLPRQLPAKSGRASTGSTGSTTRANTPTPTPFPFPVRAPVQVPAPVPDWSKQQDEDLKRHIEREVARQVEEKLAAIAAAQAAQAADAKVIEEREREERAEREKEEKERARAREADELRRRVEELEKKNTSQVSNDSNVFVDHQKAATVFSPDGNRRVAQALVAMARSAQDKGHLDKALESYKQALVYVPTNTKLLVRIDEVKAAMEEGKTLQQFKRDRVTRATGGKVNSGSGESPAVKAKSKKTRPKRGRAAYDADEESENQKPAASVRPSDVFGSMPTGGQHAKPVDSPAGRKKRKSNSGNSFSMPATEFDADTDSPARAVGATMKQKQAKMQRSHRLPLQAVLNAADLLAISSSTSDTLVDGEVRGLD